MSRHQNHPCGGCANYFGSVWKPVSGGQLGLLDRSLTRREFAPGQALFEQGAANEGVHCVSRGVFALRALHSNGSSTLLRLAYPGDLVGFRSFLRGRVHRTEARALVPSRVCSVRVTEASTLVEGSSQVYARLVDRCLAEVDAAQERIIASMTATNRQRLIRLLLRLFVAHGQAGEGPSKMRLPLSRADMADMLGVEPETMSRQFRRLREDGLLTVSGRVITVPSLTALAAAAE